MSASILYKFRTGMSYESLPLPGTSARVFDVKRGIVKAKRLESSFGGAGGGSALEFDLQISNAATDEVYDDESAVLPRGTRVIVRRVRADRGRGLLGRLAEGPAARPVASGGGGAAAADNGGYYTFRNDDGDDEEDFVDAEIPPPPGQQGAGGDAAADEERELEALRAVTDQAGSVFGSAPPSSSAGAGGAAPFGSRVAGQGPPQRRPHHAGGGRGGGAAGGGHPSSFRSGRPDADPELRAQERLNQPRKEHKGVPRTFLQATAAAEDDGEAEDGGGGGLVLKPSEAGFKALVNKTTVTRSRDLGYALRLTATTIPGEFHYSFTCFSSLR